MTVIVEEETDARSGRGERLTGLPVALVLVAAGGGLALLTAGRPWDTVHAARPAPLADLAVAVSGRTVEPGVTGLAVVALAGVVALLATRGLLRQVIGGALALTGALITWRALAGLGGISVGRGRELIVSLRTGVTIDDGTQVRVAAHATWPVVAIAGGVLVLAGGLLVIARSRSWRAMGARYEAPVQSAPPSTDAAADPASDLALWKSLDRGEDPTT